MQNKKDFEIYFKLMWSKGLKYYENKIKKLGFFNGIILDVGCGPAEWTIAASKYNKLVIGIDKVLYLDLINKKLLKYKIKNVKFKVANAENMPFKDSSFDYVICSLVLPYVNNEKVMNEIKRVLKKGGKAYFLLHGFGYYLYKFFEDLYKLKLYSAGSRIFVILNTLVIRNKNMQTFQTPYRIEKLLNFNNMKVIKLSIGGHPLNPRKTFFRIPYTFEIIGEKI